MPRRVSGKHKEIIRIEAVAASGVRFSNTVQPTTCTGAAVGERTADTHRLLKMERRWRKDASGNGD